MDVNIGKTVPIRQGTFNLVSNNKSRMKGDFHVRFCERLAGEIPACLLDRNWGGSDNPNDSDVENHQCQPKLRAVEPQLRQAAATLCASGAVEKP